MKLILILVLFFSCISLASERTPNPSMTPGSYCTTHDNDFKEYRYKEQIAWCSRNVSHATKADVYRSYGVEPDGNYTIDHLIPLSLGGSNSRDNLWPQHRSVYSGFLERRVYYRIRDGNITRKDAVELILNFKYGRSLESFMEQPWILHRK